MISEPSRPEGPLVISDVEFDSVHLSWKPPSEDNGGCIQGYIIEAKDVLHMDVRKMQIWSEGEGTEFTVRNLENSHIYQFRVYAQNEAGRSEGLLNKTLVRIKAKTKKPPRPSKPTAEPQGDDSTLITWTIPEAMANLNFLIERFEPRTDLWFQCNRETVTTTAFLVTGLSSEREYKFRVSSENQHGVSKPSEQSDLVQLKQLQGEAPYVLVPLRDCYVKSNECAVFRCEYAGTKPIQVQWTKDGLRVSESFGAFVKTENDQSSELQLTEVDSDDDDCSIQCSLKNNFGKASSEAKIRTLSLPELRYPSSYKEGLTYDFGDTLRLRVTASGTPAPDLSWFFNGDHPSANSKIETRHETGSMEIRIEDLKNEHSGSYKIVARNELGEDSVTVRVTISGPPDPPVGCLWFDPIEKDEISLNWNPPQHDGGSEVFSYQIEKRLPECCEWLRFSSTHKTSLNLEICHELEGCHFRVRAVNIYGSSEPSVEQKFEKERSRICKSVSSTQITNNFQEPSNVASEKEYESTDSVETNSCIVGDSESQRLTLENEENEAPKFKSYELHSNITDFEKPIYHSSISQETFLPLLRFANRDSEIPIETIYDYTEMFQEVHYPLYIFEEFHSCTICSIIVVLEFCDFLLDVTLPTENFCSISIVSESNYLEVFSLVTYMELPPFRLNFEPPNQIFHEIIVSDQTRNDFIASHIENVKDKDNYNNIYESIIVTLHPFILEESASTTIVIEQSYICHSIINYYEAVAVFTNQLFETVDDYVHEKPSSENAVSRIQTNNDSETLVDILPMPVTTYKPAMSVLPTRRTYSERTELNISSALQPCKETTYPFMAYTNRKNNGKILNINDSNNFHDQDLHKSTHTHDNSCPKETASQSSWMCPNWLPKVSPCTIENQVGKLIDTDVYNQKEKNVSELLKSKEGTSELFDIDVFKSNLDETNIKDLLQSTKDNLELVGFDLDDYKYNLKDYDIEELLPLVEETSEMANVDLDEIKYNFKGDTNSNELMQLRGKSSELDANVYKYNQEEQISQELIQITDETSEFADIVVWKYNLKEKSVEELLQLAEEVERSFSEKADQIESLESVLQEELTSLEKDLQTVNDIHKNLNNSFNTIESEIFEHLTDETNNFETELNKDLIELNGDVPLLNHQKMQSDEYAPEVIVHLQNRIVQCGNRTRLYCSINGHPIPDIFWFKNGKPLPSNSRYICTNLEEYGLFIDIYNVKSTDSGEYTCIATNRHGSVQSQAYVQVVGKRENSPEEPKFLKSPDDVSVNRGETVRLEWKITGTPFPSVIWFKNAEKLDSSVRIDTFCNHRGVCRLVLRDVGADDTAIFTCYLENECGSAISTILLSVIDGTVPTYDLLSKDNDPFQTQLKHDSECFEALLLKKRSFSSSIELPKLHHEKYLKTKKPKESLPGPPSFPFVMSVGPTWVLLSWTPSKEETMGRLEYRVESRPLNGRAWREVGRTQGAMYIAYGFKRGRSYVFRVSSGSSCGGWGNPATVPQPVHFPSK